MWLVGGDQDPRMPAEWRLQPISDINFGWVALDWVASLSNVAGSLPVSC